MCRFLPTSAPIIGQPVHDRYDGGVGVVIPNTWPDDSHIRAHWVTGHYPDKDMTTAASGITPVWFWSKL